LYSTLDLHGLTAEEAERAGESWLKAQQAAGEGRVRLITGRGLHSVGPPVLPVVIEDLLQRLHGAVVARYQLESGGGAFSIDLVRPTRVRSTPAQTTDDIDPAVALEAQQSLAELGVDPTPALLRLEVERIVKKRRDKRN
jgi:hypothetical protein